MRSLCFLGIVAALLLTSTTFAAAAVATATGNIPEVASKQSDLSDFVQHVRTAGLGSALEATGPFTVFAPTNSAFNRVPKGTMEKLMQPANRGQLQSILKYHVVRGTYTASQLMKMKNGSKLRTLEGKDITITHRGSNVYVDGQRVTQADVRANNGVIHKVDAVLMPPR